MVAILALLPLLALLSALAVDAAAHPAQAQEKRTAATLDDLPRHEYEVGGDVTKLVTNEAAMARFAAALRKDLESDLAQYDITNKTILDSHYAALGMIALLEDRFDDYLSYLQKRQAMEPAEGRRLTMGLALRSYVAARRRAAAGENLREAYAAEIARALDQLPYEIAGKDIRNNHGMMRTYSRERLLEGLNKGTTPVLQEKAGKLPVRFAIGMVNAAMTLRCILPFNDLTMQAYEEWLKQYEAVEGALGTGR